MAWHDVRGTRGVAPRQRRLNLVLPRGAAPANGFFKFVAHKESIVLCLHPLFNVTQSRRVNRCSCSHPQKARLPMSLSSVGMTTSCSTTQLRKTSFPIELRWKPYALQCFTVGKGGREWGCDLCAHEVDLHQTFAIFSACLWLASWSLNVGFPVSHPQS